MPDPSVAERILRAVVELLATRGPEAATVRNVARQAGVSPGAVQHHHPTKDDLLLAAMTATAEEFRRLALERAARAQDPAGKLRIVLELLACVDDEDLPGGAVWTAFVSRAITEPRLREVHAGLWRRMEAMLHERLQLAYPAAAPSAEDAAVLLAVTDGIAVARCAEGPGRMDAARARRLLELALRPLQERAPASP